MKSGDVKLLWGHSGNRCAICNIELIPNGEDETIGEMAHRLSKNGFRKKYISCSKVINPKSKVPQWVKKCGDLIY